MDYKPGTQRQRVVKGSSIDYCVLRILLEQNTALLSTSRVYIAGVTSQIFWIIDT